jgi:hypothetical protein
MEILAHAQNQRQTRRLNSQMPQLEQFARALARELEPKP